MGELEEKPVWLVLLAVVFSTMVGMLIGSGIGAMIGSVIYQGEGDFFTSMADSSVDEAKKIPLMVIQGFTTTTGFLVAPYLTWHTMRRKGWKGFSANQLNYGSLLLAMLIVCSFVIVDSAIIEWNQNIVFPDFLKGFEEWAHAKEDQLAGLMKMLTKFNSFSEFLIGMIVIGVLAGVCEEFLFRGIFQNELNRATGNIHVAIWISAFLFSAIHVQFFGFLPRMLLGAMFGYLYHWSGNLLVPMFAHFVNNGFSVLMLYLYQQGIIMVDLEKETSAPWPAIIAFAFITAGLLFYFKKYSDSHKPSLV